MRIATIGTGYVGLVSGACFSEFGIEVVCVDIDADKVARLTEGQIPIYEPGLELLVAKNVEAGRLTFTTDLKQAVSRADAVFIAVGTPTRGEAGDADLGQVFKAAADIADALGSYTVVVTKSTVPVGTGREVERIIRERRPDADFDIASNPEFLREGSAINDFMRPDRVVIGAESEAAVAAIKRLYRPLFLNETPFVVTDLETAELIKYAANSFLATKITFINEIADLCDKIGADVQDVARGIGLDGRIGPKFLHAGPGYGGSCFPKDTRAFAHSGRTYGAPQRLVETVVQINEQRRQAMAQRIIEACGGSVAGLTLAMLGLTFKPNTDDIREAPSLAIIPALQAAGAKIRCYDPAGMPEAKKHLNGVTFCADPYEAIADADALAILTEWNEFRALDLARIKTGLRQPLIIDLRNIYKPLEMLAAGIAYHSLGRRPVGTAANRDRTPAAVAVAE